MIWLHIIADLFDIPDSRLDISEAHMKKFITHILSLNKLQELGCYYHTFWNKNEITWVIALAESHVSFHIWPEKKYISLDIFVCNLWEDNSKKAENVFQWFLDEFSPESYELQKLERHGTKKP